MKIEYLVGLFVLISISQARIIQEEKRCAGYWTQFFDRDDPSGFYDYEALSHIQIQYPQRVCAHPIGVDARVVGTLADYTTTGEVVQISPSLGLICKNSNQVDKRCEDYEVRFCCEYENVPKCPGGEWTNWFDRDNPSGTGDWETLSDLQAENTGICASPIEVHAALLDGSPYTAAGQMVTVGPSIGLMCKNADNQGGCKDYKVRFCCAKPPVCPNKEDWTQWYDRDNPSGYYDWEGLGSIQAENPEVCDNPVGIEARLVESKLDYSSSGELVSIGPSIGFYCKNDLQTDKKCEDYEVRFCCPKVVSPCREEDWTAWYNRDSPSGYADYEEFSYIRSENPNQICDKPTGLEAQTLGGVDYMLTGEVVTAGPTVGLICYNADQPDKKCEDYKVRFCCPKGTQEPPACPKNSWTQWFDRDNPSGYGDYETLNDLQQEYPGKICPSPSGIEVQLIDGRPYTDGGDIVSFSPSTGFSCVNSQQPDKECADYRVRFCCFGESTCPSNKWTQWFDRDNPSGYWDWEGLAAIQKENPNKVCDNPSAVDAQLTNGSPYTAGGDVVSIGPNIGLTCENAAQSDRSCNDYKVRFCCAAEGETPVCPADAWTQWYNRDSPGGTGDWETLSELRKIDDTVCEFPTAIDAKLASNGEPYTTGGNVVTVSTQGLICQNNQQPAGTWCKDYKVRFCCSQDPDTVRSLPAEATQRQDAPIEAAPAEFSIRQ